MLEQRTLRVVGLSTIDTILYSLLGLTLDYCFVKCSCDLDKHSVLILFFLSEYSIVVHSIRLVDTARLKCLFIGKLLALENDNKTKGYERAFVYFHSLVLLLGCYKCRL